MRAFIGFISPFFLLWLSVLSASAATYTVTNLNGAGAGSLPQAVSDANGTSDNDTILFAANLGCTNNVCTIILPDELIVTPSGGLLRIDNQTGQKITLLATIHRHFYVNGLLEIHNLTLSGGKGRTLFDTSSDRSGGAVFVNNGAFTMTNSIIENSQTPIQNGSAGGAIFIRGGNILIRDSEIVGNVSAAGGALSTNGGTITIERSLIADNVSRRNSSNTSGTGGGIILGSGSSLFATNTTIFRNTAETFDSTGASSGAIFVSSSSTIQLTNCTIVYNRANSFPGVNIFGGTRRLRNTVIFGNVAPTNNEDFSGSYTSGGNNVIGNIQPIFLQQGDVSGVSEAQVGISRTLGNYGGATRTLPLASNSILVNAGNNCILSGCNYTEPSLFFTDQRGVSRGQNGNVDIGAIERNIVQFTSASQLPAGRQGEFYSRQLQASGGTAPYSFALTSGSLPPGLTLNANGQISGTPTATGTYNFTVQVTDSSADLSFAASLDLSNSRYSDFAFAPEAVTNTRSFQLQILAPTAASVSVGGRVLTASGRGISGATVSLIDATGNARQARTNSFGYYRFDDVAAGQTVVVQARHKRYEFAPQVLSIAEEINNLNFTAAQ